MNIIDPIMKLLGGSESTRGIANQLGMGEAQASEAVTAAVPSLLAAFAGKASTPGGAEQLARSAARHDNGLERRGSLFQDAEIPAAPGSSTLENLLGVTGVSQLTGVLSRYTGIAEATISKLLGLLAPLVLGVIGQLGRGMSSAGLANLLVRQKGNIAAAMPAGLGNLLGATIPGFGNFFGSGSAQATRVVAPASRREPALPSFGKWLIPATIVGLGVIILTNVSRRNTGSPTLPLEQSFGGISANNSAFLADATSVIKDATACVASISDEATATAELPQLQGIVSRIERLNEQKAAMPMAMQTAVHDTLRPLIIQLEESLQPVLGLPNVSDKIRPVTDRLFAQLDRLVPPER